MARIVTAHYVDDLDNTTLSDDARVTVPFAYRGEEFSVDLTADNAAQFDNDMSKWIEAAKRGQARSAGAEAGNAEPGGVPAAPRNSRRKARLRKASAKPAGTKAKKTRDGESNDSIRDWANKNGYQVSPRGRIPAEVKNAFYAAQ